LDIQIIFAKSNCRRKRPNSLVELCILSLRRRSSGRTPVANRESNGANFLGGALGGEKSGDQAVGATVAGVAAMVRVSARRRNQGGEKGLPRGDEQEVISPLKGTKPSTSVGGRRKL
jgi:hypothetical protein